MRAIGTEGDLTGWQGQIHRPRFAADPHPQWPVGFPLDAQSSSAAPRRSKRLSFWTSARERPPTLRISVARRSAEFAARAMRISAGPVLPAASSASKSAPSQRAGRERCLSGVRLLSIHDRMGTAGHSQASLSDASQISPGLSVQRHCEVLPEVFSLRCSRYSDGDVDRCSSPTIAFLLLSDARVMKALGGRVGGSRSLQVESGDGLTLAKRKTLSVTVCCPPCVCTALVVPPASLTTLTS